MKAREYLAVTQFPATWKMAIQFDWIDNPGEVPNIRRSLFVKTDYINHEHLTEDIPKEILQCKLYGAFVDNSCNTLILDIEKPKEPGNPVPVIGSNNGQLELPFTDEECYAE